MQISQHSVKGYLTFILHVYCIGQTFESPQRMIFGLAQPSSIKLSWLLLIIFLSFNSLTDNKKLQPFHCFLQGWCQTRWPQLPWSSCFAFCFKMLDQLFVLKGGQSLSSVPVIVKALWCTSVHDPKAHPAKSLVPKFVHASVTTPHGHCL